MSFLKDKRTFITAALLGGAAVVLLILLWPANKSVNGYKTIPVVVGSQTYIADIADTPALQQLGLSGRSSLSSKTAMLFVFSQAGRYSFWMKDMKFSIDMLWLDQDGAVVTIAADATPESFPNSFTPTADSTYVLELPAGTARRENINIGNRIIFDKNILRNTSN